ncbi:hypothetical protein C8J57DRAFT_460102 [Mycena rebaudengoi]|nr:hypothetical protein C8J57DRAFT_460102 [Mycena rebaudengoi]
MSQSEALMGDSELELAPRLPPEIEREIFELTAQFPGNAVQLVLVARRARIWIERLLYETITLSDQELCDKFIRTLDSRPAQFFIDNVKSLCVPGDLEPLGAQRILKVCQGVINLALWLPQQPTPLFPLICTLRPLRLSINVNGVYGNGEPDFTHDFFSKVSHLELVDWPADWATCPRLEYLYPHLTHLAIDLDQYTDLSEVRLREMLSSCPSLVICLGLVSNDNAMILTSNHLESIEDPRFVILSDSEVLENWEASLGDPLRKGSDASVWAFGEDIVAAKTSQRVAA